MRHYLSKEDRDALLRRVLKMIDEGLETKFIAERLSVKPERAKTLKKAALRLRENDQRATRTHQTAS